MHDGTCLVTVVAGVSFLVLMELGRLGAFSGIGHAINAELTPAKMAAGQNPAPQGDLNKSIQPAPAVAVNPHYVKVADETPQRAAGPHQTRSRDRERG